jgi:hypothetical protein
MAGKRLRARHQNFLQKMRQITGRYEAQDVGSSSVLRAAPEAQVRLRCTANCGQAVFRAAERMRCPKCQHPTIVLGPVR